MSENKAQAQSVLGEMSPSKAIVKLAVPATLALLAKAVYNLVDTAYIGMLDSDIALTAVGVTVPLLLIMVSIENIFAAGAAVLAAASWEPRTRKAPAARSPPSSVYPWCWAFCCAWEASFSSTP